MSPLNDSDNENVSSIAERRLTIRWIIVILSIFQTRFILTAEAMKWLLKFLVVLLRYLGKYSTKLTEIADHLPQSLYQYESSLRSITPDIDIKKDVVCPKCESLYTLKECFRKVGFNTVVNCCSYKPFNVVCNQQLMREIVSSSGKTRYYPHKVYCYISLISSLQNLLLRRGFVEHCESTRKSFSSGNNISDVYDGSIWKDFLTYNKTPFLSCRNCYGLLLNIDWLQPYKHTQHSVGVIYIVILNLPRTIRFKRENVILFGVIPGPTEPSLTINSYLSPLVSDLKKLWAGVEVDLPGMTIKTTIKCALLGVACDLPAARKTGGFLSYTANLGCSRCFQEFSCGFGKRNDYSNFDRSKWKICSNAQHRADIEKLMECTTITQRNKKESELGCRYSVLLDLPYYRPIEMLLIDGMHILYLGTAKHFARNIWINKNYLNSEKLAKVEEKLKNSVVPVGLGRLPSSISSGQFLTADQWKNWTIYFSIYCLGDVLPKICFGM